MTEDENELRRRNICDFRHSVVAELGNPYLSRGQLTKLIKEKSKRDYEIPYSKKNKHHRGLHQTLALFV
jgi:hypothetical protein